MKEQFERLNKHVKDYSLGALFCCVAGVALLINPHIITDVLNTAAGVLLIVFGILGAVRWLAERSEGGASVFSLLGSIALIGGGIFVFRHTDLLERIIMAALGIYLICLGLPEIMSSVRIRKAVGGDRVWKKPFITACITVGLGLTVLIVPALLPGVVMRVIGGLLLAGGIGNFIGGHSSSRILENMKEDRLYKRGKPASPKTTEVVDITDYTEGS